MRRTILLTRHKMQQGISLLELMLSLSIIALILVLATRYYLNTRTSQQVNEAAEMITSVYSAGEVWMQSANQLNDDMMHEFLNNGSVPKDFANPKINPWGGDIETATISPSQLKIILKNVPVDACRNL